MLPVPRDYLGGGRIAKKGGMKNAPSKAFRRPSGKGRSNRKSK